MTDSATFTLRPIPKAAFIAGYAGLLPQIIAAAMWCRVPNIAGPVLLWLMVMPHLSSASLAACGGRLARPRAGMTRRPMAYLHLPLRPACWLLRPMRHGFWDGNGPARRWHGLGFSFCYRPWRIAGCRRAVPCQRAG